MDQKKKSCHKGHLDPFGTLLSISRGRNPCITQVLETLGAFIAQIRIS